MSTQRERDLERALNLLRHYLLTALIAADVVLAADNYAEIEDMIQTLKERLIGQVP